MKMPRVVKRHCPHCNAHHDHDVERVRTNPGSEMKKGQRRFRRVMRGYRGFPRPKPEGLRKPTRRVKLRYRCQECRKAHQPSECFRAGKFELTES